MQVISKRVFNAWFLQIENQDQHIRDIFSPHYRGVLSCNALHDIYINWVLRSLKIKTQRSRTPSLESDTTTFVLYSSDTHNHKLAVAHSQLLAPRYGTTCRLTSQLRRHSRSSDSTLRHFCSRAHTLTLSVNLTNYVFFSTPVWT